MKIHQLRRVGGVLVLLLISLAAYKSIAVEAEADHSAKQCCSRQKQCPDSKPASHNDGSIIWESIFNNLLSSHL